MHHWNPLDRMMQSCSSWYKLKKLMAWILRYHSNLQHECCRWKEDKAKVLVSEKSCPISVEEMHSAKIEILKCVQRQSFRQELSCLQNKETDVKRTKSVQTDRRRSVKSVNPKILRIGRQKRKTELFLFWPKRPIWLTILGNDIKRFDFLFFS